MDIISSLKMSITLSVVLKRHSFLSLAKQLDGSEGPGQGGRMLFPKGMGFETTWTSLAFSHVKKSGWHLLKSRATK